MISALTHHMPHLSSDPYFTDKIITKRCVYQYDTDVLESWSQLNGHNVSIDKYWAQVFKLKDVLGQPKYPHLR